MNHQQTYNCYLEALRREDKSFDRYIIARLADRERRLAKTFPELDWKARNSARMNGESG